MDRNFDAVQVVVVKAESLSARRAWIEIVEFHLFASSGVSLSARRAWIEMLIALPETLNLTSRSPQGERG